MSDGERRMASNGIWLCQNCAKLVDNDVERYTTFMLRQWKHSAEGLALDSIGKTSLFAREAAPTISFLAVLPHRNVAHGILESSALDPRSLYDTPPAQNAMVEVLAAGKNALNLSFVVAGVSANHGWDWDITYFVDSESGWYPHATLKLEGQRGRIPSAEYLSGLPGGLLLHRVAGSGTGIFRTDYALYRIGANYAEPMLNFPSYLHVVGWGMPFDRHLELLSFSKPAMMTPGTLLSLRYRVRYEIGARENESGATLPLLENEFKLNLVWSAQAGQFVTEGPSDNFAVLDEIWNEGTKEFVERCHDDLLKLQETGTAAQKTFVERYVE